MDRKILNLRFNKDQSCFTCAMESGVRIYNVEPLCELKSFDVRSTGSVKLCEMVNRSNVMWLVSGGHRPKYPDNCVAIFDIAEGKFNAIMRCPSTVTAVCMKPDKIVVSLARKIFVYSFPGLKLLMHMDVKDNTRGLLKITPSPLCDREIIIFPGCSIGTLQIVDISNIESAQSSTPVSLECHNNELACITLNEEGTKAATASVKGTIIRIWDTIAKKKLLELRRGCEPAVIYSLSFNKTTEYLCCSSDKGTGHIFAIDNTKLNKNMVLGGWLGKLGVGLKSFATFQFPPECPCVCGFGVNNSINIVGLDGTYNRFMFNIEGHCDRDIHDVFLDLVGDYTQR